jgi:hypothetical protein
MISVFGASLRGSGGFLSPMLDSITGLGCSFVYIPGGILSKCQTYTETINVASAMRLPF